MNGSVDAVLVEITVLNGQQGSDLWAVSVQSGTNMNSARYLAEAEPKCANVGSAPVTIGNGSPCAG